jgi:REP-associated tyrosine transposase
LPRSARVIVPGEPHHVVQRGNRRQTIFFRGEDYAAYLDIAASAFEDAGIEVWSYCLMPNHVHLIVTPSDERGLATAMQRAHIRYTRRVNAREDWTGCLWQGRFASFPMDEDYLLRCARYVGLNPVRAGLVKRAEDWPWSSVRAHLTGAPARLLRRGPLVERLGAEMAEFFKRDCAEDELRDLRAAGVNGRPLGAKDWIQALEAKTGRTCAAPPRGRPATRLAHFS